MQSTVDYLAVRSIVCLDPGISPSLENVVCLCMSKPKLVREYLNNLPNLRPALGEAHINVLTAGIPRHRGVTLLSTAVIANPSSTMPSRSVLRVSTQERGTIRDRSRRHLRSAN